MLLLKKNINFGEEEVCYISNLYEQGQRVVEG